MTAFCLPDVTWHHCTWLDLPRLLPLYVQVHCGCVQAGRFYNMKDIDVFLGRGGVRRILVPWKISQAALKVIKRWWKIKVNGMHSFLFQMKMCPQKCLIFANMNWTLGDTHEQLDKNTVPSSPSHCLILKMWTQVAEERLNGVSTAEPFQKLQPRRLHFWFQSQTRMPFICHI